MLEIDIHADDGLCIIQPITAQGAQYARASDMQVVGAARHLINDCMVDGKLRGGVATHFGKQ